MTTQMNTVIQHLRSALLRQGADQTDGQLLECFVSCREAVALEALVLRHGPMVWGVCRRVLRNHHDAEDAFQAAFLVLVRKAASIAPREMVGNWLYGVAHQTALKARATAAKLRARERQGVDMPEPAVEEQDFSCELQAVLDQELSRLPDKYRVAIVFCDLEGKTRKEAARQLGLPEGTLAGRLTRGRTMLAKRLARHGLAISGGMLAAALSRQAAAAVPTSAMTSTIKAVTLVAAGQAAAAGLISVKVAALTDGVLTTMLLTKLKTMTAVLLVLAMIGFGGGLYTHQRLEAEQRPAAKRPALNKQGQQGEEEGKAPKDDEASQAKAPKEQADAEADLKVSREIVVGTTRVVLLQVSRITEFRDGVDGKAPRAITSVQVVYLMENLGDKPINNIYVGAEAFAPGTTDPAVPQTDPAVRNSYVRSVPYKGYRKRLEASATEWAVARLPKVKDLDEAHVVDVTFDNVEVLARKVDLRLSVGLHKGDEHRVLFRNVTLE